MGPGRQRIFSSYLPYERYCVSDARNGHRRKNGRVASQLTRRNALRCRPLRIDVVFVMEIAAHFPPLGIVPVYVPSHRPLLTLYLLYPDAALAPGLSTQQVKNLASLMVTLYILQGVAKVVFLLPK